ncbi:hypothetical protein [Micromonospora cathayae]|uniref:Secreted protein n=1 Tax=Micromonospora cathayae TaxID=3028804 RepID=A0ABY7ZXW6_9ACTN|nr:hypothetical protein [Micromonospora sp. HUAS 3]WDZ86843.1 hypothetical protein PVK37_10815 [Micromonospora sp. HUAS 3]
MSPFFAVFLVLLLGSTSYAAGRLHGQLSYRIGYRFGYRQGYFDGDRGAWNRRRRGAQAALASALAVPPGRGWPESRPAPPATYHGAPANRTGTTYTGSAFAPAGATGTRPAGLTTAGRQPMAALGGGQPVVAVGVSQSTVTVGGRYPTGTLAGRRG